MQCDRYWDVKLNEIPEVTDVLRNILMFYTDIRIICLNFNTF